MVLLISLVALVMLAEGMILGWWLCANFAPRSTTIHIIRKTERHANKVSAVPHAQRTGRRAAEATGMGLAPSAAPAITSKTIVEELAAPASAPANKPRKSIKFDDWQKEKLQVAADAAAALKAADANIETEYDVVSALENQGYSAIEARKAAHGAFLQSDGSFDDTFRLAFQQLPDRTVPIESLAS